MNDATAAFLHEADEIAQIFWEFGREFQALHPSNNSRCLIDPDVPRGELLWRQFRPRYESLLSKLRELKDGINAPPPGCATIAEGLRQAVGAAKQIHDVTQTWDDLALERFLDLYLEMNTVSSTLGPAIGKVRRDAIKRQHDDVFALANAPSTVVTSPAELQPTGPTIEAPPLASVGRMPIDPGTTTPAPDAKPSKGRGGRPPNNEFYEMIIENDALPNNEKLADAALASAYNRRYSRRRRKTAAHVADTRNYMKQPGRSRKDSDAGSENT